MNMRRMTPGLKVDNIVNYNSRFRELLAILMMITLGLSGRGIEMTSLRYINTMEGDRSIYVEDGQLMFITEYHKSMALMKEVKVYQDINLITNVRLLFKPDETEAIEYIYL